MSYLRYLCLFAYSDVQHILCCVCFVFLRLAIFSGLSILVVHLVFSNVYLYRVEQTQNKRTN